MRQENRLRKLENRVRVTEQHIDREIENLLRGLSHEELLRLHTEHVENRILTPEEEAEREQWRTLSAEEMLRIHAENCR